MKKIFIGVFVTVSLISCNNDDNIQPVITLNGATDMTTSLNGTFVDPGATANDNVDGDLTANIVVTSNLDVDQVGNYHVYYNVEDSQGNNAAQATRNVTVVNDADFLIGSYSTTVNCPTSDYYTVNNLITELTTSETVNNDIFVSKFEFGGPITGYLTTGHYSPSDDSLHFDAQPSSYAGYQGGYGKVTPTGFELINFFSISDFNTSCAQVRNYIKQ